MKTELWITPPPTAFFKTIAFEESYGAQASVARADAIPSTADIPKISGQAKKIL